MSVRLKPDITGTQPALPNKRQRVCLHLGEHRNAPGRYRIKNSTAGRGVSPRAKAKPILQSTYTKKEHEQAAGQRGEGWEAERSFDYK